MQVFKNELRLPPDLQGALEMANSASSADLFDAEVEDLLKRHGENWVADCLQRERRVFHAIQTFARDSRWHYTSIRAFFFRISIQNKGKIEAKNISLKVPYAFSIIGEGGAKVSLGEPAHIGSLRPGETLEFEAWTKDTIIFGEEVSVYMDGGAPTIKVYANNDGQSEFGNLFFELAGRVCIFFLLSFVIFYSLMSLVNFILS